MTTTEPPEGGTGSAALSDIRLAKATTLMKHGDEWLKKPTIASPKMKYEYASNVFRKAAEIFRAYGRWRLAGEAYSKCADAEKRCTTLLSAATYYTAAGECLTRVDGTEAIEMFRKAIAIYASHEKFVSAAALQVRIAELFDLDEAISSSAEAYAIAADYYLAADMYPQAVQMMWLSGSTHTMDDSFSVAFEAFHKAARYCLDDNLSKFRFSELTLDAALCLIATGNYKRADEYVYIAAQQDGTFSVGREKRFLFDLIDCAREWAGEDVLDKIWNFDYVAGLQPHQLRLLEVIHEEVSKEPSPEEVQERQKEVDDARKQAQANAGRLYEEDYEIVIPENQYIDKEGKPLPDNLVSVVEAVSAGVDPATLVKREMSEQLKDKKKRKELEETALKLAKNPFATVLRSEIDDFVMNMQAHNVDPVREDEAGEDEEGKESKDSEGSGDHKEGDAKGSKDTEDGGKEKK